MPPGAVPLESPKQRLEDDPMAHREKPEPGMRSVRSSMPCPTAPRRESKNKMATLLWVLLIVCSVVASPHQVAAQSAV